VLLVNVVENGLELVGISEQITTAIIGALLVGSVLIDLLSSAGRRNLSGRTASRQGGRPQAIITRSPEASAARE
jgi:hypothetical protein